MRVAILTSSDSGAAGEREDLSGPLIREIVEELGALVVSYRLLPDEREQLSEEMRRIADNGIAELILTTGGTGFSKRDCMPEATLAVIERQAPGIPEAMRAYSMQFTGRAMLSRAVAGIRKETLIVNLPGSPKAVRETLAYIFPHLQHGIEILTGAAHDCARDKSTDGACAPFVFAVCGVKNSGKTTYMEKLIAALKSRGVRLAAVKHDGHDFEADVPGSDSYRLYRAGADAAAVYSEAHVSVHARTRVTLAELTAQFADCELVLVEGGKDTELDKIELVRRGNSESAVSNPSGRVGIATDIAGFAQAEDGGHIYPLDDVTPIADWIADRLHDRRNGNKT